MILSEFIQYIKTAIVADASPSDVVKQTHAEECTEGEISKKEMVLKAVINRGVEIQPEDLPRVEEEMLSYFDEFKNEDYFKDLTSAGYYKLLDLRERGDVRVVVIGDVHCDYKSLAAILLKLSVSEYDYFENAYFVFLGDYLDRGCALFEPLLLLMDLKRILGDRLIMLRGNHEMIEYDEEKQELSGKVLPLDSVPCLNEYCIGNKPFLKSFADFYRTLPTYVYLKTAEQNILLTHGAIPKQVFIDVFRYDEETGAIVFADEELTKLNINQLHARNQILTDMIWGDPSSDLEKYQVNGRFEFGSKQFEAYAQKNNLNRVFRSHEPVDDGFESFFGGSVCTVFSTGGAMNEQTGYPEVEPAFAVIGANGYCCIENSYLYHVFIEDEVDVCCNLYSGKTLKRKEAKNYSMHPEFYCTDEKATQIGSLFKAVNDGFPLEEE